MKLLAAAKTVREGNSMAGRVLCRAVLSCCVGVSKRRVWGARHAEMARLPAMLQGSPKQSVRSQRRLNWSPLQRSQTMTMPECSDQIKSSQAEVV
jgi:hypothetical protein